MNVVLPTRCIEVEERSVKLKETSDQRGAYITLSHRWSPQTRCSSTTTHNLDARLHEIPTETLPQTFRDAIFVTRCLGIPYLWIDSLCIVQDGDGGDDWKYEAMRMSEYYQHAVLTIAAHDVERDGFLRPPNAGFEEKLVRLPYRNLGGTRKGYFYLHRYPNVLEASSTYAGRVLTGKLLTRGWVLQEWLLSRRIVHYTEHRIFFECQSTDPLNDINEVVRSQDLARVRIGDKEADGQEQFSLHRLLTEGTRSPQEIWHHIVQAFSGSELTRPDTDRIIALSGVAKEIRAVMRNLSTSTLRTNNTDGEDPMAYAYVSGLWMQDLHVSLLWEQRDNRICRPSLCGAPTWSWAAWLNPVHWRKVDKVMKSAYRIIGALGRDAYHAQLTDGPQITERTFDVDNHFTCLVLRGKLKLILVGARPKESDCAALAKHTGVAAEMTSRWLSVSDLEVPNDLIGWADIEETRQSADSRCQHAKQICLAFHVSTYTCGSGGLQFGRLGFSHNVDCLLLIAPTSECRSEGGRDRYTRAGVARIFKSGMFLGGEEIDIELV